MIKGNNQEECELKGDNSKSKGTERITEMHRRWEEQQF